MAINRTRPIGQYNIGVAAPNEGPFTMADILLGEKLRLSQRSDMPAKGTVPPVGFTDAYGGGFTPTAVTAPPVNQTVFGRRRSFDQMGPLGQQAYEADFEANNASRFWQNSLDTLASGGMPKGFTAKPGAVSYQDWLAQGGQQTGDNPVGYDYFNQNYNLPSFVDGFSNLPIAAALAFGTAGAFGGLDQFAAGAGSGVTGGAGAITEAAPLAGSTGPGVSPAFDPAMGGGYWGGAVDSGIAGGASQGTALSRLLGLTPQQGDLLSVLGTGGATGLGMFSANKKAKALKDIANQSRADRAPFLNTATNYLNNPSAYIQGPGQAALKGTLHALSAKFGNPIGSGSALQIATDSALQDWRNATTGFANIGLSGEDTRSQLLAGSAGAESDIYTTLAGGASDIINPRRRSLADLAREMKSVGLI